MLVTSVPAVDETLIRLVGAAASIILSQWLARNRLKDVERIILASAGGVLGVIGVHSLYKLLFAISGDQSFISFGLSERTLWEVALLGAAAACWRFQRRTASLVLLGAGTAHLTYYTMLLHNPLWAEQAVGALPVFNLILAVYAVLAGILWAADRLPPVREYIGGRAIGVAWMLLILLFSASELRQLFHGNLLVEPGLSQAEDIARSILAIAMAIGVLLWGIRTEQRDWRIASLLLMLVAVAKVFLWDTQGLEGLIRIASFVALGFSLIGIGWLYARFVNRTQAEPVPA